MSNKTAKNKTAKNKTAKNKTAKKKPIYARKHYESNDGMLTTVWGPGAWHFLHTISFNYPTNPSCDEKRSYKDFILQLQYVLPCGKCRKNLKKNFKKLPLLNKHMESRETFSKYVYNLHELVNTMLHKKSGLSYKDVRERYEHFRARCSLPLTENDSKEREIHKKSDKKEDDKKEDDKKEDGCTEPIYGEKSKCVLKILPQKMKCDTFQMDEKCIKRR